MDLITISDLEVKYHVGVPDDERAMAQRLLLTLEISTDFAEAAKADDLKKTVDYYAVTRELQLFGDGKSWKLIERLAVEIAEMVLDKYEASKVSVEVKKFILTDTKYVSVRTVRSAKT